MSMLIRNFFSSITSFGNRPNDFESAANFFRIHFERVGRRAAPNRPLYVVSLGCYQLNSALMLSL